MSYYEWQKTRDKFCELLWRNMWILMNYDEKICLSMNFMDVYRKMWMFYRVLLINRDLNEAM